MDANCVKCKIVDKICRKPDGHGPAFCPTQTMSETIQKALTEYDRPQVERIYPAGIHPGERMLYQQGSKTVRVAAGQDTYRGGDGIRK